jgi:hypothetical protein
MSEATQDLVAAEAIFKTKIVENRETPRPAAGFAMVNRKSDNKK